MALTIVFSLLSLLLVSACCYVQPLEESSISGVISDKGLEYAKELLIEKGIASIVMLQLPEIENSVQVHLVGLEFHDSCLYFILYPLVFFLWLQLLVDVFEGDIASAVEEGISEKIKGGIVNIDNLLQSLPEKISLDKTAALNVFFVGNPVLSNSSISIAINGLFTGKNEVLVPRGYQKGVKISAACGGLQKMLKVSIHENVFKSASLVYYNAGKRQLIIDELPDQNILNTAEWRFIVPQLYKRYPNDDMQLNISISSPQVIQVTYQDIGATIFVDITIVVLEDGEVIPVACISVEISASCAVEVEGNNTAGWLRLQTFSEYLKWSKIGKLRVHLIQSLMSSVLKTVVLPYLNFKLKRGFPLPIIDG
ncbi:Putative BPI/LBP family protein [Glycine soja]|nr:Putative BPI/LBP family protein [Glycine soja]